MRQSIDVVRCSNPFSDQRLERWADGLIRGEERQEVDDHLARCPDCRQRAEAIHSHRLTGF